MALSKLDRKIISLISQDIPLVEKPFEVLACKLGVGEDRLIGCIKQYKKKTFLRKYSAVLNHRKVGFKHNAMVVWNIPVKYIGKAGAAIASFPEVSHCYERKRVPDWNYNLYSMIHGKTKEECFSIVKKISEKIDFKEYRVLFSSKEYKKTGVRY